MREARVGRILVASLHQGIADVLPLRLGFYENWLGGAGLGESSMHRAPLLAVLSFLRQEGDVYHMVTTRAGEYAADWTVDSLPAVRRAVLTSVPNIVRRRFWLGLAARLVRHSYGDSRVVATVRRDMATINLRASIFCSVRQPVELPLCGYYAAAFTRLLTRFDMPAQALVVACRGTGATSCVLEVSPPNALERPATNEEAV